MNDPPEPEEPDPEETGTVTYSLTVIDNVGNDISDTIKPATIRGTVTFRVNILERPSWVAAAKLEVTGLNAEASPYGCWYMTEISDTIYELAWDTTQVNDGYYNIDVVLIVVDPDYVPTGGGGDPDVYDMVMSSFTFDFGGTETTIEIDPVLIGVVLVVMVIVGIGLYQFLKKKSHRRGRK